MNILYVMTLQRTYPKTTEVTNQVTWDLSRVSRMRYLASDSWSNLCPSHAKTTSYSSCFSVSWLERLLLSLEEHNACRSKGLVLVCWFWFLFVLNKDDGCSCVLWEMGLRSLIVFILSPGLSESNISPVSRRVTLYPEHIQMSQHKCLQCFSSSGFPTLLTVMYFVNSKSRNISPLIYQYKSKLCVCNPEKRKCKILLLTPIEFLADL